jgi:hypothetical protein
VALHQVNYFTMLVTYPGIKDNAAINRSLAIYEDRRG